MDKVSASWCKTEEDRNLWIKAAEALGWKVNDDGSRIGFVADGEYYWRSHEYFGEAVCGKRRNPFWLERQDCECILKKGT